MSTVKSPQAASTPARGSLSGYGEISGQVPAAPSHPAGDLTADRNTDADLLVSVGLYAVGNDYRASRVDARWVLGHIERTARNRTENWKQAARDAYRRFQTIAADETGEIVGPFIPEYMR